MNTVGQLRELIGPLGDDVPIVFAAIHPDDEQYLDRSIENKVAVILEHPVTILHPLVIGRGAYQKDKLVTTIYLTHK